MARQKAQLEKRTFVKGIVTEANALTFPENASIDEQNFVLNRDGSRQRRLGMNLELADDGEVPYSAHVMYTTSSTLAERNTFAYSTYRWENVGNDPLQSFLLVQVGNKLYAHPGNAETLGVLADRKFVGTIGDDPSHLFDYASVNGFLVVVAKDSTYKFIFNVIRYTASSDVFSVGASNVYVRDLWGVDDGLEVDERDKGVLGVIGTEHHYNLLNQGWPEDKITNTYGPSNNEYPSNADIPWICRKSDGTWDENYLDNYGFGNTPAPKGKFIINAFDRGGSRESASGLSGLDNDSIDAYSVAVSGHAGRLFVSVATVPGTEDQLESTAPVYTGAIFFSKTIDKSGDFSKFYQEADPTAEDSVGLVATDGGYIKIAEAGVVTKLISTGPSLLAFSSKGVWEISGPDGIFSADSYSVYKVTEVAPISKESIVATEQGIMYWANGGIYVLQPDSSSGRLTAVNITENSIQSLYGNIPQSSKSKVKGAYDSRDRKVRWLFDSTGDYTEDSLRYMYDSELIFDLVLGAFTRNTLYTGDRDTGLQPYDYLFAAAYVDIGPNTLITFESPVTDSTGEQITTTDESNLILIGRASGNQLTTLKYLTIAYNSGSAGVSYGFSYYKNSDFKDFGIQDAYAYLVTGHEFLGDTQRRKQTQLC